MDWCVSLLALVPFLALLLFSPTFVEDRRWLFSHLTFTLAQKVLLPLSPTGGKGRGGARGGRAPPRYSGCTEYFA